MNVEKRIVIGFNRKLIVLDRFEQLVFLNKPCVFLSHSF